MVLDGNVIGDIEYLPEWDQVAMVSASAGLRLLNAEHVEVARSSTHALSPGVLDHSRDGTTLVVGGGDGTVKVLAVGQLQTSEVLWHETHIRDVTFLDSQHVATCLGDGSVHAWDLQTGIEKDLVPISQREMLALALDPNGGTLYASGMRPSILRLDVETGRNHPALEQGIGGIASLSISPDGKRLAAGSRSGAVLVFAISSDDSSGEPLMEDQRAEAQVLDVAFAASPNRLAVAYSDNHVIILEVPSGRVARQFELPTTPP